MTKKSEDRVERLATVKVRMEAARPNLENEDTYVRTARMKAAETRERFRQRIIAARRAAPQSKAR